MKSNSLWLVGVFLMVMMVSCATEEKKPQVSGNWINNMHRLSTAYLELMPYVADGRAFSNPKNQELIRKNLLELQLASAQIARDPQPPNADPIIQYTSTRFAVEMRQANTAFEMRDLLWARYSLSHASDYCINCHTSISHGARDFPVAWQLQLANLPPAEKIESLLATRQYASALNFAHSYVWNKTDVKAHPRTWQLAIERVMAMVVRVNNDSAEAQQLASSALSNEAAPFYIRNDAAEWFEDINSWRKEKPALTEPAKLKLAKVLITAASSRPHVAANLIPSLRASALLHGLLEDPKNPRRAEILLQAGLIAQSLRDINLGDLDQYYFEGCIRARPHSDLAEDCFAQLETSLRGTNIFMVLEPEGAYAVEARLSDLRQLAEVRDPEGPPGWKARIWNYNIDEKGRPKPKKNGVN